MAAAYYLLAILLHSRAASHVLFGSYFFQYYHAPRICEWVPIHIGPTLDNTTAFQLVAALFDPKHVSVLEGTTRGRADHTVDL